MSSSDLPTCFLFDNGSLRAAATLSLREVAQRLAKVLRVSVRPVSLLHSSGIDPHELGGTRAELLEPALLEYARSGGRNAILLPLFFGPSAALTEYVPARVAAVCRRHPELRVRCASWLVREDDASANEMVEMLKDAVCVVRDQHALRAPWVILTDHGSPQRGVTAVRDELGLRLRERLGPVVAGVSVASMERRPGDDYRFNEPLLEDALQDPPFEHADVIVALQFLQSGRHAGAEGDIAAICRAAEEKRPGLRTYLTEPLVKAPRLLGLLERRYREALTADASARSNPPPAHTA